LILVGIVYLVMGFRGAVGGMPGSLPRMLVGLAAVVVGSSIVRWVRRARSE
jgi:xanthosine utilization system XapX-like protein